jgi:hypothetical protein
MRVASRSIGKFGTLGRVAVGVALLALAIIGLPPWGHLIPIWQLLIGLVALPAVATLAQLARLAFSKQRLNQSGEVAAVVNCVVITVLAIAPPTRGATLVFLGFSMLVAAIRGYGGCESLAVSNLLLRRDDQVGCLLFSPIDKLESHPGTGVTGAGGD